MKKNKYLCYTIQLLVISLFYFLFNTRETINKPYVEYILALFLVIVIIVSILFWSNPIKNSKIHKIDSIIAKIVILSFIIYTLLYKFKFSLLLVLLAIAISFYFSNYYSKQEWCSDKHLFCHGLLHIFCFIATLYTFSPI
jgi:phosphatidylserine synthase